MNWLIAIIKNKSCHLTVNYLKVKIIKYYRTMSLGNNVNHPQQSTAGRIQEHTTRLIQACPWVLPLNCKDGSDSTHQHRTIGKSPMLSRLMQNSTLTWLKRKLTFHIKTRLEGNGLNTIQVRASQTFEISQEGEEAHLLVLRSPFQQYESFQ